MKNLLFSLLIIFSSCTKCQDIIGVKRHAISIIVEAGDSNGTGSIFAPNSSALAAEKGAQPNMKILNPNTLLFETLNIGVNNNLGGGVTDSLITHGVELALGNETDSGLLQPTTYIVKIAHSGYKMTDLLGSWWAVQTSRLDAAVEQVTDLNNGTPPVLYFFMSEGGNDMTTGVPAATWKTRMITYVNNMREVYGKVVIFAIHVALGGVNDPLTVQINTAMDEIATELSDFYIIPNSGASYNIYHLTYSGFKTMAYRFINILKSHYKIY